MTTRVKVEVLDKDPGVVVSILTQTMDGTVATASTEKQLKGGEKVDLNVTPTQRLVITEKK